MNGRILKKGEKLIHPNELDEPYCLHHIKFKIESMFTERGLVHYIVPCDVPDEVIAIPNEIHEGSASLGSKAPSDVSHFYHQFMVLQVVAQLYDGFEELLSLMAQYDKFESYNCYKFWFKNKLVKRYMERGYEKVIRKLAKRQSNVVVGIHKTMLKNIIDKEM